MKRANPYSLKKPCANCPFLRDESKAISLHPERVPGIISSLISGEASSFSCHKTTNGHWEEAEDSDDDTYVPGGKELQCAGSLIALEKMGIKTDLMQLAERVGMYEPDLFKPYRDTVKDFNVDGTHVVPVDNS